MKLRHASLAVALTAALLGSQALPAVAAPADAPSALPAAAPGPAASPDYDGDGKADVAATVIGDLEYRLIRVWYGSGATVDILHSDLGAGGYGIAWPLLARDLNGDGYTDLVAADNEESEVRVLIIPGSSSGLQPANRTSFVAVAKPNPTAVSLALVESPVRRLAVGAYTDDGANGLRDEVGLFQLTAAGLPTGRPIRLTPGKGKVPSMFEGADFGRSMDALGSQLFIGAPYAKVNGKKAAGAVLAVTLDSSGVKSVKTITQATKSVTGAVGASDGFGQAVAARDGHLVVGAPGDTVGKAKRTGSIQVFTVSSKGAVKPVQRLAQSSPGIPGKAERDDRFGGQLALGAMCKGVPAVLVGGGGEAIAKGHDIGDGSAWLVPLRKVAGCTARQIYEGHGLPGKPGYRYIGELIAFVRDRGAKADDLVVGGGGSLSEGPAGRLYRISATTGTATKLGPDEIFDSVAGR